MSTMEDVKTAQAFERAREEVRKAIEAMDDLTTFSWTKNWFPWSYNWDIVEAPLRRQCCLMGAYHRQTGRSMMHINLSLEARETGHLYDWPACKAALQQKWGL